MKKNLKLIIVSLIFAVFLLPYSILNAASSNSSSKNSTANGKIRVIYFFANDCSNCQKIKPFIAQIKEKYKDKIEFLEHDVKEKDECLQLFLQFIKTYNLPDNKASVPIIFVGKDYLLGTNDIQNNLSAKIEEKIAKNEDLLLDCHKFLEDWENGKRPDGSIDLGVCSAISSQDVCSIGPENTEPKNEPLAKLSMISTFTVGFLAGFNPCLLAILAFIASITLANTGRKRHVIMIVAMFSLGIFATYLIVGLGLLKIINGSSSLHNTINGVLISIIAGLGLWNLYDAYYLRKNSESSFYTPKSFIKLTESVTKKVSLPAAFLIGSLFSLIKAPCVGAIYLVILDTIKKDPTSGMLYLASYNFGVVLPVLLLGIAIAFGMDPKKVEEFRKNNRVTIRIVTGASLVIIAILMYMKII